MTLTTKPHKALKMQQQILVKTKKINADQSIVVPEDLPEFEIRLQTYRHMFTPNKTNATTTKVVTPLLELRCDIISIFNDTSILAQQKIWTIHSFYDEEL